MVKFAKIYSDFGIVQQLVAQLSWTHNIILLDKKGLSTPICVSEYKFMPQLQKEIMPNIEDLQEFLNKNIKLPTKCK